LQPLDLVGGPPHLRRFVAVPTCLYLVSIPPKAIDAERKSFDLHIKLLLFMLKLDQRPVLRFETSLVRIRPAPCLDQAIVIPTAVATASRFF
jgi:hypothetical protein